MNQIRPMTNLGQPQIPPQNIQLPPQPQQQNIPQQPPQQQHQPPQQQQHSQQQPHPQPQQQQQQQQPLIPPKQEQQQPQQMQQQQQAHHLYPNFPNQPKQELKPSLTPNQPSPGGPMMSNAGMQPIPPHPSPKMPKPEPSDNNGSMVKQEPATPDSSRLTPRLTSSPGPPSKRPKQEPTEPLTPNPDQPKQEPETKPKMETDGTSSVVQQIKKWPSNELLDLFKPVWEKIYNHTDAPPFQVPVDPISLQIPDYLTVVKTPMDLKTIRHRLDSGAYTDPWMFVSDMWLMFDNAWLYNRRNSRVYRMCTKLAEEFQRIADPAMRRAGFCCAQKLNFTPLPLCCFGKATCTINVGAVYFCYEPGTQKNQLGIASDKIYYCEKCFSESKGTHMSTSEDNPGATTNTQPISKEKFIRKKNDEKDPEQFLNCKQCGRQNHEICVLHKKEIWKEFICDKCLQATSKKRKENRFTASRLPECALSKHIEGRVNRIR